MTDNTVKVVVENTGASLFVNMGTTLQELEQILGMRAEYPFIAAYVNNLVRELTYRIYSPVSVRFIDVTHYEGMRVYQRTLSFVMDKAVADLFPDKVFKIKHSVSKGFYCEIEGMPEISQDDVDAIKRRMQELINQDIPIVRRKMLSSEAEAIYENMGADDKIALMRSRPHLYVPVYTLANMVGNFYGRLAVSTGALHLFDVRKYYQGLYLAVPRRGNPGELEKMVPQNKMFEVFTEYKRWVRVMGVQNVGSVNNKIIDGHGGELIKIAEAFHEKKLGKIADQIHEANEERKVRIVLISGPSSSGKTTFAKRLGIQLRILGLTPVLLSLDDYFVERDKTPLDENGEYDFEALEALDLEMFNDDLAKLLDGGSVDVPRYDFITGKREYHEKPLQLHEDSILVIEGIHALNPRLTQDIDDSVKFKVYISAFTSISIDNLSRVPTTDNRLLRRMIRDYSNRGHNASATLKRWESVRRGEDKHIFPYQENADVMFNSSLFYEISVLKNFAIPLLLEVPDTVPEYGEAVRLLLFIDNFISLSPDEIPPTSLLREFIGGSSFLY